MGHTIDPRKKLLNSSRDDRINHLNKHFKEAEKYIDKVENSSNLNRNTFRRKVSMFRYSTEEEIAKRKVVLKRLSIMEKELDKEVTNEILIKK